MSETERLTESVKELLGGGRDERLAGLLENAHAADISSVLRELPLPDQVRLFRLLSSQHAGEVLSELDDPTQRELLRALDEQEVSRVLDQMPADDVVEVVEELPKEEAEKILDLMAEEKSEEVQELLEYREGTAGRLMSPNVVAVHEAATVAQVGRRRVLRLRRRRPRSPGGFRAAPPIAHRRSTDAHSRHPQRGRGERGRRHGSGGSGPAGGAL